MNKNVFIAKGVQIIDQVKIGEYSSIWYNSVLRGDNNWINIGDYSNIQDNCVLHVTKNLPVNIGNYVTVGHGALVHGSTIGNNVLVGMGSIVLDGCRIDDNCLIGAGALLLENTHIPKGSLVVGSPAKVVRKLSVDEIENIKANALNYANLCMKHLNNK